MLTKRFPLGYAVLYSFYLFWNVYAQSDNLLMLVLLLLILYLVKIRLVKMFNNL